MGAYDLAEYIKPVAHQMVQRVTKASVSELLEEPNPEYMLPKLYFMSCNGVFVDVDRVECEFPGAKKAGVIGGSVT